MNTGKVLVIRPVAVPQLNNRGRLGGVSRNRRQVRVFSERAIFQTSPPCGPGTLEDARDALDACSFHTTVDGRRACFVTFGLDVGRVDAYYHTVQLFESSYKKAPGDSRNGILNFFRRILQKGLNAMKVPDPKTSENKEYA